MTSVRLGRYKLAFWQPSDAIIIYSKMYDELLPAQEEAAALENAGYLYTIMEIRVIGNGNYTWEVLQEGVGKHLPILSKIWDNRFPIALLGVLVLLVRGVPKQN